MINYNKQPKLIIKKDEWDKRIEFLSWVFLVILIALPLYFYNQLPDEIPMHFDINGKPDRYDEKGSLFLMPGIGVALFFFLNMINKYPHTFNYLTKITEDNARAQYTNATKMTRWINFVITIMFVVINTGIILIGLGKIKSYGMTPAIFFTLLIIASVGYYIVKSTKIK